MNEKKEVRCPFCGILSEKTFDGRTGLSPITHCGLHDCEMKAMRMVSIIEAILTPYNDLGMINLLPKESLIFESSSASITNKSNSDQEICQVSIGETDEEKWVLVFRNYEELFFLATENTPFMPVTKENLETLRQSLTD